MSIKILVADDELSIRNLLSDILEVEINNCEVILAENGQQAIDIFFSESDISLCILDVMMPVYNGYEVLETIREHSDVPILMLTAMGSTENELESFKKGVNDYVSKPFNLPILIARLKRLLKNEKKLFTYKNLKVDLDGHNIWINDEEILLTPREFSLFSQLIQNENLVLSREQLLLKAWGYDYEGDERTVDTHIKALRKKLCEYGEFIITIRGSGYKFQVSQ